MAEMRREMRLALRFLHLSTVALLIVALGGYSEGRPVRGVSPRFVRVSLAPDTSAAPGQVAAALLIQEWSQILWGLVTSQTGTQPPSFGEPVFNPDGSVTQSFTTADGTELTLTAFPDGTAPP